MSGDGFQSDLIGFDSHRTSNRGQDYDVNASEAVILPDSQEPATTDESTEKQMSAKHLKIKLKSLAAEARIIRREELKLDCKRYPANIAERTALAEHRRGIVRWTARHSHLAYGYLRGRPYRSMEVHCHEPPDWDEVLRMVKKYGPASHNVAFQDWSAA